MTVWQRRGEAAECGNEMSCPYAGPSGLLTRIAADQQAAVAQIAVGGNFEVRRRRPVLEDTAGKIEGRSVAGAEEAAGPICTQRRVASNHPRRDGLSVTKKDFSWQALSFMLSFLVRAGSRPSAPLTDRQALMGKYQ